MARFIASMAYDVSSDTPPASTKLLLAELVGRRWKDHCRHRRMPRNSVWAERTAEGARTADDVHDDCARDLEAAAAAVRAMGRPCQVTRAFIQVSGGGTYGMAKDELFSPSGD